MKNKVLMVVLNCLLIMNLCNVVQASGNSGCIVYRWSNIRSVTASIDFSGTSGNYSFSIDGKTNVSRITATAKLFYKTSGGRWIEVNKDWSYDVNADFIDKSESFTGVSGREYKIVLAATVYINASGEPVTKTTYGTCP